MKKKKIIIILVVVVLVTSAIAGVLSILKNKTKEKNAVHVYSVSELSTPSEMYEYSTYYYGYVDTSMEQNIYLSSSQQVKEVKVTEGQEVKAGDVLVVYDTTAQELALDLMRADVEIARAAIVVAERELEELKQITPVPETPPTTEEPTTEAPVTEEPTTETPVTEESTTEDMSTPSDATTEQATTEEPTTEAPVTEEPTTEEPTTEEPIPEEDVYTEEELKKAISDKEDEIKSLKIEYQLKQIDLEIMEYQNAGGEVVANFDGVVKTVMDQEEAILNSKPFIVVSGDSGYTVNAELGELSLGTVSIGDQVEMYCYENGMSYTGTITEISDTPMGYGNNHSTESYYLMKISVESDDYLSTGMGMDITMNQTVDEEPSFYISLAYVVEENGKYYVMKENNGKLEKVYLKTGQILWGSEIKVYSGITMDDYIAFPHSKDAVEGAKTKIASMYDMYY